MLEMLSSIGIIGGADGPTAIFLTTSDEPGTILWASVLMTAVAFAMVAVRRKKK